MRTGLLLAGLLILLSVSVLSAQQDTAGKMQDVIYDTHGFIYRGRIVEQLLNRSVEIFTPEGSSYLLDLGDIEKVAREPETEPFRTDSAGRRRPTVPAITYTDQIRFGYAAGTSSLSSYLPMSKEGLTQSVSVIPLWFISIPIKASA